MKFVAAALLSLASATEIEVNLDLWKFSNWGKFAKGLMHKKPYHVLPSQVSGVPTISQCADDVHVFSVKSESWSPHDIGRGHFSVNIDGTTSRNEHIDHVHVIAKWGIIQLEEKDISINKDCTGGEDCDVIINYDIPSFAPGGQYSVHATTACSDGGNCACFDITFTL